MIRFESEEAYGAYNDHPAHQRFADFIYSRDVDILSFNFPIESSGA